MPDREKKFYCRKNQKEFFHWYRNVLESAPTFKKYWILRRNFETRVE